MTIILRGLQNYLLKIQEGRIKSQWQIEDINTESLQEDRMLIKVNKKWETFIIILIKIFLRGIHLGIETVEFIFVLFKKHKNNDMKTFMINQKSEKKKFYCKKKLRLTVYLYSAKQGTLMNKPIMENNKEGIRMKMITKVLSKISCKNKSMHYQKLFTKKL